MEIFGNKKTRKNNIPKKRTLKEIGLFLADILYNAVVIILLVVIIRTFLISPFRVIGSSMANTLENNEFILIDKLSYRLSEPKRGDPIVFLPPITNKYPQKFEESVNTDEKGIGILDISGISVGKQAFYCQNLLVKHFWFCKEKVEANDLVFYKKINESGDNSLSWNDAKKLIVSKGDIKNKKIIIQDEPNQSYVIRIYDSTGPEYFVKRIIGTPGDTIKIENGRAYLKTADASEFKELDESYLNQENSLHTYLTQDENNTFIVPKGHYFVMGDNRNHSNDSRHWFSPIDDSYSPFVATNDISGKVLVILWPPTNIQILKGGVLQN